VTTRLEIERSALGPSPFQAPRIMLGCGNFGGVGSAPEFFGRGQSEDEAFALMDAAWELGITWFDTADAYGGGRSEEAIGRWCRSRGARPQITTKTYNPTQLDTTATVYLERRYDGFVIPRIHLEATGEVPGIDQAEFERLAGEAERGCPVSKVHAAAEITVEATLVPSAE
jgi:Aldo/keto reductase family